MLGNKFDNEILVGWPVSKRFYVNAIGQTLKKCWFAALLPTQPPKKFAIQGGFFFFFQNPGRHYLPFIKNCIFNDTDSVALTFIWNSLPLRIAFWILYYL